MTATGKEIAQRRDEWLALIKWTKERHTARQGCAWIATDEEILNQIEELLDSQERCNGDNHGHSLLTEASRHGTPRRNTSPSQSPAGACR